MLTARAIAVLLSIAAQTGAPPELGRIGRQRALELAAERNLDLLVQQLDVSREDANADAARSTFIPQLRFDASYDDGPPSLGSARTQNGDFAAEVEWSTPVGSAVTVRAENDEAFAGNAGEPQHDTALSLSVRQSLLRGGWRDGARSELTRAEITAALQRERFRDQLNALLVDVERAYWEVAYNQADVEIKTRSCDRARAQFEDTQQNIERGLVAPGEIYVVEENVVFFEQQRIAAEERLVLAQRQLARLLQLEPEAALEVTDPLTSVDVHLPESVVQTGLERNGDLEAERLALHRSQVQLAFDENQILPTLDLEATFALNGLDDDLGRAWKQTMGLEQPEYRVGLNFAVPLAYGPSWSRVEASETRVRQRVLRLKDREERLRFDLENLVTQVTKQKKRLALAERRVELAELKLQTEQEKYKNGITTLTDVVRFQRDLDGALIAVRRSQADLLTNHARLLHAMGTLHESRGIVVEGGE